MQCKECFKELRGDNSVGYCVQHRNLASSIIAYKKQHHTDNKIQDNARNMANYYAKKPKLEDRICQNCQMIYSPTRIDRKFCSQACGTAFWRTNNKARTNDYFRDLYANDLNRKLSSCLRSRLRKALKENIKSDLTMNLLGCSVEELKKHLESKFLPGMSWNNWMKDGWHIDHIKPLASFDLSIPAQQLEACHYSNLQPLWAEDNLKKGNTYAQ